MNYFTILSIALSAYLSKSISFRVGSEMVTVTDLSGKPTHLTLTQAMAVVGAVLTGQTGTFQSGDINVNVAPYPNA